nr:cation transporter dimerization domain-containing protein [Glycomyces buryatensis]
MDADLTVSQAHAIAAKAEHRLIHRIPRLTRATIHTDPSGSSNAHQELAHHR